MPPTAVEPIDLWLPTVGVGLIGLCLTIHSFFLFAVLHSHARFSRLYPDLHGVWMLVLSVLLATALIAASCCIQIVLWALVLWSTGDFALFRDALYYSSTTYTTLGASHRVLHAPYRALEPLEATNGLLANGLNTAILFAVISSLARRRSGYEEFFK
jgi:multisubunit Na+/H+ antiporter MnhB subunit